MNTFFITGMFRSETTLISRMFQSYPKTLEHLAGLQKPQSDIDNLRFGVYLDMLTTHEQFGYQYSMHEDSHIIDVK